MCADASPENLLCFSFWNWRIQTSVTIPAKRRFVETHKENFDRSRLGSIGLRGLSTDNNFFSASVLSLLKTIAFVVLCLKGKPSYEVC